MSEDNLRVLREAAAKQMGRPCVLLRPSLRQGYANNFSHADLHTDRYFKGVEDGMRVYGYDTRLCWVATYHEVRALGTTPALALDEFDWICTNETP